MITAPQKKIQQHEKKNIQKKNKSRSWTIRKKFFALLGMR